MKSPLSDAPQYDHHVRIWWFVINHEYQHMLWTWIDMCRQEAERHRATMKDIPEPAEAEYNLAMDYIINDMLLDR